MAKFRHEMKYIITESQYDEISRVLHAIMKHDSNIRAVSYTHLDVYKRQGQKRRERLGDNV